MTELNTTMPGIVFQKTVEAKHAQSDSFQKEVASDDFQHTVAHKFVTPKKCESAPDDTVQKLAEFKTPDETILELGVQAIKTTIVIKDCQHQDWKSLSSH